MIEITVNMKTETITPNNRNINNDKHLIIITNELIINLVFAGFSFPECFYRDTITRKVVSN